MLLSIATKTHFFTSHWYLDQYYRIIYLGKEVAPVESCTQATGCCVGLHGCCCVHLLYSALSLLPSLALCMSVTQLSPVSSCQKLLLDFLKLHNVCWNSLSTISYTLIKCVRNQYKPDGNANLVCTDQSKYALRKWKYEAYFEHTGTAAGGIKYWIFNITDIPSIILYLEYLQPSFQLLYYR